MKENSLRVFLRVAGACTAFACTACSTVTPSVVTKTVDVPVQVVCKVATPVKPDLHFAPPYVDLFSATRDLMGDQKLRDGYETELEAALRACQ